ncbi:asparagine synthase (glutamine-hydrolysing) [Halogranum rubrum]|uniref:Asparagine synthase (Glutamine-hydrolysing) n=1 Tax=Halogranum rubrum TaxID=553466 RepID=A0A1I4EHR3_9EURY|nr:asparagine synthase-related protein [Halogranum rubrum]SFL04540.1 asparagine synthase (glutamine-hydrolysing) [Halogranum rubrum]
MTGLCGAVGPTASHLRELADDLVHNGDERVDPVTRERVEFASVRHPKAVSTPTTATEDGGVAVRVWGDLWGDEPESGYRTVEGDAATYCAERYREVGLDFLDGLNGNFAGALYDESEETVTLFTDRLATRPIYIYTGDEAVVFSTSIQSLPLHPAVDTDFEVDYLTEYFALKRPFGLKTPLSDVEMLHPGSSMTIDVDDGTTSIDRYWTPHYDPVDASRSEFAARLAETMKTVVEDRTDREETNGLLLSGGSDSRLLLAAFDALDIPVRTYHLNEWENREADIARRAADVVGAEYEFLERDETYQARSLESSPSLVNFDGYFNQHHAGGFAEKLRSECDYLFTGHYGDTLFKATHFRTPNIDLGGLGSFELPVERPIRGLDEYVAHRVSDAPEYLSSPKSVEDVYYDNVTQRGRAVVDHGVEYPSLRDATVCSRYPISNSTSGFFYHATAQMLPSGTPFLDNRLIDLFLQIPPKDLVRGNLINRATTLLCPELGDLPHGRSLVPIRYPFVFQWGTELLRDFVGRHFGREDGQSHWSDGPWTDHGELVRQQPFIGETIDANEERIRSLPFLSWEGVQQCYEAHQRGEDRMKDLYTLVTFLEMPLLDRLEGIEPSSDEMDETDERDESSESHEAETPNDVTP